MKRPKQSLAWGVYNPRGSEHIKKLNKKSANSCAARRKNRYNHNDEWARCWRKSIA